MAPTQAPTPSSSFAPATSLVAETPTLPQVTTPGRVGKDIVDEEAIFATFDATPGVEFNPNSVSEDIKDDESAEVRRKVQLGQAIMHVGPVDPNWKLDFNNAQNRPVNESHVKELAGNFDKIRRCQPQDQLDLAMTPEQFEHCLRYTVEQMKGKGGKCERPCYRDVESLRKATDPNVFYIKFDDMPVLCWDLQLGTLPSLKTGQHRRLGLILKKKIPLPYHPDQEIDEDNKRTYGWGMCIVNSEALDVKYFTAVCLNKRDVYEAANNGDNFITAYKAFISLNPNDRHQLISKPGAFVTWLRTELALPDSQDKRVRTIFARPLWRHLCKIWNETQWGRQSFTLYNFCQAAAQHLDHVWKPAIESIFTALEDLVESKDLARLLTKSDLELIQHCGHPDRNNKLDPTGKRGRLYQDSIQLAFYPKPSAHKIGKIEVDPSWFQTAEHKKQFTIRPKDRVMSGDGELLRRPGFMTALDDAQYQKAAQKLCERHYALPNPLSLNVELLDVGLRVQALCTFTIWIADPTWREPGNAASRAALWTYADIIADLYQPLPAVQDPDGEADCNAVSEEEYIRLKQQNKVGGENYTSQLRKHIISNIKVYNSVPENTFKRLKDATLLPEVFETREERRRFRLKFAEPAFNLFLHFVMKHWKTDRFAGVMRAFHLRPTLLDDLSVRLPSLFPDIKKRFSTAAKKRYSSVPSMAANPSLEEEFSRNAEYLQLRLEFEELRRLCRNWNSKEHRQTNTLPDERKPAYEYSDNLSIQSRKEYQRAVTHLQQLATALHKYEVKVNIVTEDDINKAIKWPTKVLQNTLVPREDGEEEYESDYVAPPPSSLGKPRKRQRNGTAALSTEFVDDSEGDTLLDADLDADVPIRSNKKKKTTGKATTTQVATDEESPPIKASTRKSTGGRGGPTKLQASSKSRNPDKNPSAAGQRRKASRRAQQLDDEIDDEQEQRVDSASAEHSSLMVTLKVPQR